MYSPLLSVDKDTVFSVRQQDEWKKYGINTIRVDSMQDAIDKLRIERFLLILINGDNNNYLPLLKILCDMTNAPVFVFTSNYSVYDQIDALYLGAAYYVSFQPDAKENVLSTLTLFQKYNEKFKRPKVFEDFVFFDNLLIIPTFRQIFYKDKELDLTRKEFELLYYLVSNRGYTISYSQVYSRIWGDEFQDSLHSILWNHILRLRSKLLKATGKAYIENKRDEGYRIVLNSDSTLVSD